MLFKRDLALHVGVQYYGKEPGGKQLPGKRNNR